MRTIFVRGAAVVTGSALALGLSLVAPTAHAALPAVPGADPAPVVSSAAYLAAQPESNNIVKTYYEFPRGTSSARTTTASPSTSPPRSTRSGPTSRRSQR